MQNDINIMSSEIIATYVYKLGILNAQFSYTSAIGLFNNVINFALLLGVNSLARRFAKTGVI
jgi:putative aldouronate transport system permease protein